MAEGTGVVAELDTHRYFALMGDYDALRVRLGIDEDDGAVQRAEEDLRDEIADLSSRGDVANVVIAESGIGVGASGPAIEVVVELARSLTDDATRLATLGGWVLWLIDRVRDRRGRARSMIEDGPTLGAVAAARTASTIDLNGYRFSVCRPLTTDTEGLGTDDRFAWFASFVNDELGDVLVVFMSPTGKHLGHVLVPVETYHDGDNWHVRTQDEINDKFRSSKMR